MGTQDNTKMPFDITIPDSLSDALKRNDEKAARRAFFDLLRRYSDAEIRELRLKINYLLQKADLTKINTKKIFSLQAMHEELMKRLDDPYTAYHIGRKETYIELCSNNQWIKAFYGETCKDDAIKLYRAMIDYERAVRLIPRRDPMALIDFSNIDWGSTIPFAIAVTLDAILIKYALPMVAGSLMATALVSAQIACIGIAAIAMFDNINRYDTQSNNFKYKLRRLKLSDEFEHEKPAEQNKATKEANLELMKTSLDSLIRVLIETKDNDLIERNIGYVIDSYIGYNGNFHAFKNVDNKAYTAVLDHLREIDAEQVRVDRYDRMILGYITMSTFATALAALVVGLSHTKDMFSLIGGGVFIGGYLSGVALLCAGILFMADSPVDRMPIVTKKIEALKNIEINSNDPSARLPLDAFKNVCPETPSAPPAEQDKDITQGWFNMYQPPTVLPEAKKYKDPEVLSADSTWVGPSCRAK